MKRLFALAAVLAFVGGNLSAQAQNTPRGEEKQARADRKLDRAHTLKHGESLSKKPRVVREEDKRDHRKTGKHKFKL